jgi:hypothetical protein
MRWENLFDDLESQLEQEITAEEVDLHAEEERLRLGRLSVRDRIVALHAALGEDPKFSLRLFLVDGDAVVVRPSTFGRDWFFADLVGEGSRDSQCIVPIAAIAGVALSRAQIAQSLTGIPGEADRSSLPSRLSLAFVLRDLCRRRSSVELRTTVGRLYGTIDRVGRDHIDLAVHELGSPRRESEIVQTRIVPLSQLWLVKV